MSFPSTFTAYTYPNGTDRLNSPSHSSVHGQVASSLGQIETIIGRSGDNSVLGTLIGDLRSPDSNGGGHVQTANKGGTGQTGYTKGDILIATSSSVLSKFGIGNDGAVLQADSTQQAGVKWASVISNKVALNTSSVSTGIVQNASVVIFSASILGSTLGTTNAIRYTGVIQKMLANFSNGTFQVNFGTNIISSVIAKPTTTSFITAIVEGVIVGNGGTSSQLGYIKVGGTVSGSPGIIPSPVIWGTGPGNSSVESSANQNLVISLTADATSQTSVVSGLFLVEKIA